LSRIDHLTSKILDHKLIQADKPLDLQKSSEIMASKKSEASIILDLPPACLEFSPENPSWAVIGTYTLDSADDANNNDSSSSKETATSQPQPQSRSGSLILLSITSTPPPPSSPSPSSPSLTILHTLPCNHGILDLHFSPSDPSLFATANSTGSLSLFRLLRASTSPPREKQPPPFVHLHSLVLDASLLCLSLAWHPSRHELLATSLSDGSVRTVDVVASGDRLVVREARAVDLQVHALEAWTVVFSWDGNGLLSGGDDAAVKCSVLEGGGGGGGWSDGRIHGAGVTAILPLEKDVYVTGSYDDRIRVVEVVGGRLKVVGELDLGGGVWRLKALGTTGTGLVLASCMHAGCRVVKVVKREGGGWAIDVVAKFEEHQSMNYASGWQVVEQGQDTSLRVVSSSFYDRLVCLWHLTSEEVAL
jgi:diphthamide biosynthesis protein 7